jgi:hypothetical protein
MPGAAPACWQQIEVNSTKLVCCSREGTLVEGPLVLLVVVVVLLLAAYC